jgi:hypothetical protein
VAALSFIWALGWAGSANLRVADERSEAMIHASYISAAPEDLIYAVTQVVLVMQRVAKARTLDRTAPGSCRG